MEKQPEFKDKWILAWFAVWFLLFLPLGMSSVPETHGAYWREVLILPLVMGTIFTVLAGLARPAGWISIAGLYIMARFLPELDSRNLQAYFLVASYFTLFFSVGERLTLGKLLKVAGMAGGALTFAYFLDPGLDRAGFGQGMCNWLVLILALVVVNGMQRVATSLFKRKEANRLDWIDTQ
ncbi:MAG: hypothetical protein KF760_31810 [Candidatus Eremiobacteraeota bacterium]|nr:hypothetical protein [Candidatus Eremiobacteraeota bacterium]MCW5869423.1 hypothetical protein [Candidatus Eremiobacteraeota bacterium]